MDCPPIYLLLKPALVGSAHPTESRMKQYLDLMRHVYENGTFKTDRTGTGTRSVLVTRCVLTG